MKMKKSAIFAAVLTCVVAVAVASGDSAVYHSGAYDNVVVAIKDSVSSANCKTIIGNIEVSPRTIIRLLQYTDLCEHKKCAGSLQCPSPHPRKKKQTRFYHFFFSSGENLL